MSGAVAQTQRLDVIEGLIRSTALIQDIYAATSAQHGLTRQQAQLMCVVGDQPSSMVRLAALLRIGKSSMTGLVHRAEGAGLVHRVPDPDDGRSSLLVLTPQGRRANDAFRRALSERIEQTIATLSAEERDCLAAALSKVVLDNQAPETWPGE